LSVNRVSKSQAILVSAHAFRLLLFVATASVLGRKLAPEDFGFVALVSSICFVAVELLDMGTTAAATRRIVAAPARESETLSALLALRRLIAAILFVAVLALALSPYLEQDRQRVVLVAAACGILFLHLNAYYLVFQIRQAYGPAIALGLSAHVAFLFCSAVALMFHAGGVAIGVLVVARETAQVLAGRWVALRMLGDRPRTQWLHAGMWPLLKESWMIGVAGVSYKLSIYSGGFILWQLATPEDVASFNAAQRLLAPVAEMAWWFVIPLIAAMSVAIARSATAFRTQLEGYAKLLLGMSSQLAVAGYFVAPFVLLQLYGETYASGRLSAVDVLRWLAFGHLFALVTPVLVVGEIARGNARAMIATGLACLVLNLTGNFLAIPAYGATGAAVVLFASEAFVFVVLFIRCAARGDARLNAEWIAYIAPAILLGAIMGLLADLPGLQFAVACAWAPAALFVIVRLPAQGARRASLAAMSVEGERDFRPAGNSTPGDAR
jgi:O-antigen/teichoic acid export membrane protein